MKTARIAALSIVIALGIGLGVRAGEGVSVAVDAEPSKVTIGDHVRLTIHLTHPDSFSLRLSSATQRGEFLVLDQNLKSAPSKSGTVEEDLTLTLVTFSTGTVTVPPMTLTLASARQETIPVAMPAVPIQVESILDKHKDRRDIQEIKGQIGYFDPLPWILGLLGGVLVALVAWLIMRRKRPAGRAPLKPSTPPRPPEEVAREALAALKARGLIEEGRVKEFYVELSDILRRYLQGRFGLSCLDMTTSEIVREMKAFPLASNDFGALRSLLEDCDLVKFAKFVPAPDEPARHISAGLDFVDHTAPRAAAAP